MSGPINVSREDAEADHFGRLLVTGIVGSGLPPASARKIADRLLEAIIDGKTGRELSSILMNPAKVRSAEHVWGRRRPLYSEYRAAEDKVKFLRSLHGIGKITAQRIVLSLDAG